LKAAVDARAWLPVEQPIYLYRAQLAIVPLYAQRPGRLLREESDLDRVLSAHARGLVVFMRSDWDNLPAGLRMRFSAQVVSMGAKSLVWAKFGDIPPETGNQPEDNVTAYRRACQPTHISWPRTILEVRRSWITSRVVGGSWVPPFADRSNADAAIRERDVDRPA